ncbi:hypothetical protein HanPI659440_Chr05g0188201 [Helianthus annuus]|nr:hypothetical protein HanPI659440_Chr05g0188201 [Helianthus annuus]
MLLDLRWKILVWWPEVKISKSKADGEVLGGRPFVLRDVRSYSDVVGNYFGGSGSFRCQDKKQSVVNQESGRYVVVPDRTCAFKSLFGVALVRRTVDLETLVDFDKLLNIAKISVANIQYLGGLSLLISFHDVDSANKFLDSKVVWGPWFSRLDPWNGQSFPLERVAWLRISGIPLHLFEPDVMVQLGELFGKVLHAPKFIEEDPDVSVCSIGVLVGEAGRILDSVALRWNMKSYRIWVEEEHEVWVPDCLDSSGSVDSRQAISQPVVNLQCSDSKGNEDSFEKVDRGKMKSLKVKRWIPPMQTLVMCLRIEKKAAGLTSRRVMHVTTRWADIMVRHMRWGPRLWKRGTSVGLFLQSWVSQKEPVGLVQMGPVNPVLKWVMWKLRDLGLRNPRLWPSPGKIRDGLPLQWF